MPAPPPPSALGPRQRTLNNLGRLAALATAAAALGGCNDTGYGVVDPMPAPARCAGLARTVQAKLTWTTTNTLLLELGKPGLAGSSYLNEPPRITGGKIVRSNITAEAAEIELEAPADGSTPIVWLLVECPSGRQQLSAMVSSSADAGYGSAGTVLLTDQAL